MTTKTIPYITTGCNGAGKTTASVTVLPEVLDCSEFVIADENRQPIEISAGQALQLAQKPQTTSKL
jgi:predicted ABC-type ATPase